MWKISIVQGLMNWNEWGTIFDLGITDINEIDEAIKLGKKFFNKKKKEEGFIYSHSPRIFFEPQIDTSDWGTKKNKKEMERIASSISDIDIP